MSNDIFSGCGVEVKLNTEQDFLKVRETLTRIGVSSRKDKILYQSCHILHKQGRYAIVHFKEMFLLDGKDSDFSEEDKGRRNIITSLLAEWGLITVVDPNKIDQPRVPLTQIKIITHKEKSEYTLVQKYSIGKKR